LLKAGAFCFWLAWRHKNKNFPPRNKKGEKSFLKINGLTFIKRLYRGDGRAAGLSFMNQKKLPSRRR